MIIRENIFDFLFELTEYASHKQFKIASALIYKKEIISTGICSYKSHSFQKKYGRNDQAIYFHSETNCIYNAQKKGFDKFDKATLYICRSKYLNSDKKKKVYGLAAPCLGCVSCIKDFKIKNVIYTMDYEENFNKQYGIMVI